MFVTLEGPDGSGKTTQAAVLLERLRSEGHEAIAVHEPGGTELGVDVRALLVRRGGKPIVPWAEALLFSACRAQLVSEVISPSLDRGAIVVADRYADSTLAYQGAGRGLPFEDLDLLVRIATRGVKPNLTLLLDLPAEDGIARLRSSGRGETAVSSQLSFFEELRMRESWNRFEDEAIAFHERVRDAYSGLVHREPERWVVLDATRPRESVAEQIWDVVRSRLGGGVAMPMTSPLRGVTQV